MVHNVGVVCLTLVEDICEVLAPLAQSSNSFMAFFNINVVLSTKSFSTIFDQHVLEAWSVFYYLTHSFT